VSLDKSEGFGLSNMRARATQIGATLEIQTAVGQGTIVMVNVPTSS
jgi:signal transduction histidine kinase